MEKRKESKWAENQLGRNAGGDQDAPSTLFFRWCAIVLIATYLVVNPVANQFVCRSQVFGVPVRGWKMMSMLGDSVCDVRFRYRTPGDSSVRHHDLFRTQHPAGMRTVDRRALNEITQNVCAQLPLGSQVYADVRCGDQGAWHQWSNPDIDACLGKDTFQERSTSRKTDKLCAVVNTYMGPSTWLTFVSVVFATLFILGGVAAFAPSRTSDVPWVGSIRAIMSPQVESTRGLGLVRILTAAIFWARYAHDMLPFHYFGAYTERGTRGLVATGTDPDLLAAGVGVLFLVSTCAMLVGFKSRFASAMTAASAGLLFYWHGHHRGHSPYTHHHCFYHAVLPLLLACTPCGRSFSLDRLLSRGGGGAPERGALWAVFLFKLHVSLVYLFAAYDKLSPAWWNGDRLEQLTMFLYTGSSFPAFPGMGIDAGREVMHALACAAGQATIVAEFAIGAGIWVRSLRGKCLALGVGMHGAMYLFCPVSTFTVSVYTAYLAILDPSAVDLFTGAAPDPAAPSPPCKAQPSLPAPQPRDQRTTASIGTALAWGAAAAVVLAVAVPGRLALWEGLAGGAGFNLIAGPTRDALAAGAAGGGSAQGEAALTTRRVVGNGTFEGNWLGIDRRGEVWDVETPVRVREVVRVRGFNKATHTAAKGSPVLTRDGKVLVGSDTGALFCFEMEGQRELRMLWSSGTWPSQHGIHGTPCILGDVAFLGAYDGALYAFDIASGRRVWKTQIGGYIGSSPLCIAAMGAVAVTVETDIPSGIISLLNASTGHRIWEDRETVKGHPHSSVGLDEASGTLVFGANDKHLYAYNVSTGALLWKYHARGGGQIKGPIAVYEGRAFFGAWNARACAVSLGSGREEWCLEMKEKAMAGAAVDSRSGTVFFGGHAREVVAADAATGAVKWRFATGGVILGGFAVTRSSLLFGCNDGKLYALKLETGALLWTHIAGRTGQVSSVPMVTPEGLIFFASRSYQDPDKKGANECSGRCVTAGSFHVLASY